jgi:hypothetical protein
MPRRTLYEHLDGHDAYELLGVPENASAEEIQRAHRREVRAWHPDPRQDDGERLAGVRRTTYLNLAREILLDHRAGYDAYRRGTDLGLEEIAPPPSPGDPPDRWTEQPRRRRPVGPVGLIAALAVTIAVPLVVVRLFLGGSEDESGLTVPARFAGTWSGSVRHEGAPEVDDVRVRLTLKGGAEWGDIDYPEDDCGGSVTPLTTEGDRLTLQENVARPGRRCAAGRIDITRESGDRLRLEFVSDGELKSGAWALVTRE